MDDDLQNRAARKALETLLAYSKEFGTNDTVVEPEQFGLTAAQFSLVVSKLVSLGLVDRSGREDCLATADGLVVASDPVKLDALLPVDGDPSAPLPSELVLFGKRPYERAKDVPPPMSAKEYHAHVQTAWAKLLKSGDQDDEAQFQEFLARHPCLLPDAYGSFRRGASRERNAYFSEPELPGFRSKRPDFMTITYDSAAVVAFLIEIEAPAKPWATGTGQPSAKLTQALGQIRQWKVWFREPENVIQFTKLYGIDERRLETRQFIQRYALVYGRRNDASANSDFAKGRALLAQPDEDLMTYDRLVPSERIDSAPTLGVDRSMPGRKFSVLHVPPTFVIGPYNADTLLKLAGLREAILANSLMSAERRVFLASRLDYWMQWAQQTPIMPDGLPEHEEYYYE